MIESETGERQGGFPCLIEAAVRVDFLVHGTNKVKIKRFRPDGEMISIALRSAFSSFASHEL